MKSPHIIGISAVLAAAAAIGAMQWMGADETRTRESAPAVAAHRTSDPRASAGTPTAEEIHIAEQARVQQIALGIERALVARDPRQRETAFVYLLPELIELQPERLITMVARQEPGETRDALRDEVVRQWVVRDRDAAVEWMGSLEDESEREAAATLAMRTLAATAPAEAIEVADRFGIGRNDGSLEHLVQIWATENPEEALRWVDSQPPADPRTAQLRARIELVRARFAAGTY
jgi:hypothetical protein